MLKRNPKTLAWSIALLGLAAASLAQGTDDGQTPANEGVCDVLIGATPGLYGLCVAFCEANDLADEAVSITTAALEELEMAMPSGALLANYDRRKTDSDPDMPCILVDDSCPCWSPEELASVDGFLADGSAAPLFWCGPPGLPAWLPGSTIIWESAGLNDAGTDWDDENYARTIHRPEISAFVCQYQDETTGVLRTLSIGRGTLTMEQFENCHADVTAAQELYDGICDPWNTYP